MRTYDITGKLLRNIALYIYPIIKKIYKIGAQTKIKK